MRGTGNPGGKGCFAWTINKKYVLGSSVGMVREQGRGLPGGAVVRNPPANAGDAGSSPGLGGSHMPQSN